MWEWRRAIDIEKPEVIVAKRFHGPIVLLLLLMMPATVLRVALAQQGATEGTSAVALISGEWRGNSECAVKDSPCHDEVNVYRFIASADKPGQFEGFGSKIVDGKEVPMGSLQWKYNAPAHALEAGNAGMTFRLVVNGASMEGTLSLPDRTVYRRIHLKKVE